MIEKITIEVLSRIRDVEAMYHRLVLLVGPPGSGKTRVLHEIERQAAAPRINVGLELSKRLLGLSKEERRLNVASHFEDIVSEHCREMGSQMVLLDNIEILFDSSLCVNVLPLLQRVSRNTTLVVAWPGYAKDGFLGYAEPGHSEYCRWPSSGLVIVQVG